MKEISNFSWHHRKQCKKTAYEDYNALSEGFEPFKWVLGGIFACLRPVVLTSKTVGTFDTNGYLSRNPTHVCALNRFYSKNTH